MNTLLISFHVGLDDIGIKYIHNKLLSCGYHSILLYISKTDEKNLACVREFVRQSDPGFIGFSLMSHEAVAAARLTQSLRSVVPDTVPIIWGGIHPTACPEESLLYANYVCLGEGDIAVDDIVHTVEQGGDLPSLHNMASITGGCLKKNSLHPLVSNLDSLPFLEHRPRNGHVQTTRGILPLDQSIFRKHARYFGTSYSTITSRGCPFSCTYCCNNFLSGLYGAHRVRRRSVEHIISELEEQIRINPFINTINFQDDCFLACGVDYLTAFRDEFKSRIGIPFIIRSIPTFVDEKKIALLQEAGLAWISLGLQSGSDRICREVYQRKSLRADFLRAARIIHQKKIAAFYDVILDNPYENEDDRIATVQTLLETPGPYFTQIFSLCLYPGTALFERVRSEMPEILERYSNKDYLNYEKDRLNDLIKLATTVGLSAYGKKYIRYLLSLYIKRKTSVALTVLLVITKLFSSIYFEPLAFFRVMKRAQRGSILKTAAAFPVYVKEALGYYLYQFK